MTTPQRPGSTAGPFAVRPFDLERFVEAQDPVFDRALEELHLGRKQSHWMWFVFPQLKGLGRSPTAQVFGLGGIDQARAYLDHPVLGPRLGDAVAAVRSSPASTLHQLFGSPDDLKFRSSMTLFAEADEAGPYLPALERWGVGVDARTLALLHAPGRKA